MLWKVNVWGTVHKAYTVKPQAISPSTHLHPSQEGILPLLSLFIPRGTQALQQRPSRRAAAK